MRAFSHVSENKFENIVDISIQIDQNKHTEAESFTTKEIEMKIEVRQYHIYQEVIFKDGNTTIETGFCNKSEVLELIEQFKDALMELEDNLDRMVG